MEQEKQGVNLPSVEEEKKNDRIPELQVKIGELSAEIGELKGTFVNLLEEVAAKDRRIGTLEGQVKSLTAGIRNTENQIILDKEMIATKVAQEVVKRMIKPVAIKTLKQPSDQPSQ